MRVTITKPVTVTCLPGSEVEVTEEQAAAIADCIEKTAPKKAAPKKK